MDLNFNKNEDQNKLLLSDLRKRLAKVKLGGGSSKIEKAQDDERHRSRRQKIMIRIKNQEVSAKKQEVLVKNTVENP